MRFGRTPILHACVGVLCPLHMTCARYAFVDGTHEPSTYWLASCVKPDADGIPEFIGYIATDFVGPPAPRQFTLTRHGLRRMHGDATVLWSDEELTEAQT